jgi:transforming growth factor-beta-induced protein
MKSLCVGLGAMALVVLSGCGGGRSEQPGATVPPKADSPVTTTVQKPVVEQANSSSSQSEPKEETAAPSKPSPSDLVDTAVAAGSFKTLVTAVKAAGLVETLKSEGPFTVFAPTDEAFAKLPEGTLQDLLKPENKQKLADILTYHVVAGKVTSSQVVEVTSADTLQGQKVAITATNGGVKIDNANVVKTDILCSNGIIHVIDAVLLPKEETAAPSEPSPSDLVDTAVAAGSFKTLVTAVKAAGLVETLKSEGPFTVFAPTDEAFAKLPEGTLQDLLKPENKQKLADILTYHVVAGKVMAADVVKLKEAKTVQGSTAKVTVKNGKVKIDKANVVKTDIICKNGVIHIIDAVIMPE